MIETIANIKGKTSKGKHILWQIKEYKEQLKTALVDSLPHPISTIFYDFVGRWPTNEELRAYIDMIILPEVAMYTINGLIQEDRDETLAIRELQKLKLIELIKKNDKKIKS